MNVDPLNVGDGGAPSAADLGRFGIRGVRLVSCDDAEVRAYVEMVQAAGLAVLAVITEQSGGYVLPTADVVQLGNEPDQDGTGDTKSPGEYVAWWALYWGTWFAPGCAYAGRPVIGAGLNSGQTAYWRAVVAAGGLPGASALAVHPYAKTAQQAQSLLTAYRAISPTLPQFVSEWHRPAAEVPAFLAMLRQTPGVLGHAWFAWHDYDGLGITDQTARLLGAFG